MASILNITNIFDKEQKRRNRFSMILVPSTYHEIDIELPAFDGDPLIRRLPSLLEGIKNNDLELCMYKTHRPHFKVEENAGGEKVKIIWTPIDVVYYETIGLANKIQGAVKDYIKKGNVPFEAVLVMLDPKGLVIEEMTLKDCTFIKSEPCRLSYEDTGAALTKIRINYKDCIYS